MRTLLNISFIVAAIMLILAENYLAGMWAGTAAIWMNMYYDEHSCGTY